MEAPLFDMGKRKGITDKKHSSYKDPRLPVMALGCRALIDCATSGRMVPCSGPGGSGYAPASPGKGP